jgi:hypothetical protein
MGSAVYLGILTFLAAVGAGRWRTRFPQSRRIAPRFGASRPRETRQADLSGTSERPRCSGNRSSRSRDLERWLRQECPNNRGCPPGPRSRIRARGCPEPVSPGQDRRRPHSLAGPIPHPLPPNGYLIFEKLHPAAKEILGVRREYGDHLPAAQILPLFMPDPIRFTFDWCEEYPRSPKKIIPVWERAEMVSLVAVPV